MLLGTDIPALMTTLVALDVDVLGLNCSTGPEDMRDAIRYLGENSPLPLHCIPNAGIPHQGPDGETIFPQEPGPLAETLGEYVERYGVGIVGGCCGTTPEHIKALVDRVKDLEPSGERPAPGPIQVSSMITAAPLVQEPRPTLVGERVNSQGSKKAKELLLADDYDGLLQIAEDQVSGGAHVLDVCVALTERQDEDEQMSAVVERISLTQPAPIQIDSTEPEVIEAALEHIPGRAIVNSVNLEAGPDKLNRVAPLAKAHGACLIALTIDEEGMAKTGERKVEIAKRIKELVCDEHGLEPEALIFDALTFTLTTGDEEWRPSAVETIEGIRQIKAEIPGVKTSLGVSNVSFGISPGARAVLNSVFLHHCVEAGLDLAMVNPNHITPYSEIPENERELTDELVFNRSEDALEKFIEHFESKGEEAEQQAGDPTEGMEPEEALHWQILHRKKEGVEDWIDKSVDKIGAVPTLNTVLLPAMKEVGDKFGAGELILPFVLQSATVMKKAVARLENYLERIEGHSKGKVVIATVFGDVHDIGKSLVNTILTNNGYTVVDLGKQVPIDTIVNSAIEEKADAIGLSALLVSTSKQMPAAVQELHAKKLEFPVLIGGAAINRDFGRRILYPGGKDSDEIYEPGVFYCKDAFVGLDTMDELVDPERHEALVAEDPRGGPDAAGEAGGQGRRPAGDGRQRAVEGPHRRPDPRAAVLGRRARSRSTSTTSTPTSTATSCSSCTGAGAARRARSGARSSRATTATRASTRSSSGCGTTSRTTCIPRARLGYFPVAADGNELVVFDPDGPRQGDRAPRLPAPAEARPHLPRRLLPADRLRREGRRRDPGRDRRRRGDRGDGPPGAGGRVRRAALHPRHRRPGRRGARRVAARTRRAASSASTPTRAAATPGATPPAPTSQSTRRSGACSTWRRSA